MLTTVAVGRVYDFSHAVGRNAPVGPGFQYPIDLKVHKDGIVFVVSRSNELQYGARVSKVYIGGQDEEELVCEFAQYGDGDGKSMWPTSAALDLDGNVYLADEWRQQISVFDNDGNYLVKWGRQGSGPGELDRPSGMTFGPDERLYIVDSANNRVQLFGKDGTFISSFGEGGDGPGQFALPWGISTDSSGDVYVADWKNHRVQKFTPDGAYLASFGSYGTGAGELNHPSGVAVDDDGDVYVCDWANHRLQVYAPDGEIITTLAGDAQELSKWARMFLDANPDMMKMRRRVHSLEPEWRFYYPAAVAFDREQSRIIVADCQRSRLQIYIKDRHYAAPQFNL